MKKLGVVLLALLALLAGGLYFALQLVIPAHHSSVILPVTQAVVVRYDESDRPYVIAGSWEDAYLVQGWLHARSRLFQMDLLRRAGRARLSELIGSSMLETDLQMVRAGVTDLAITLRQNASPRLQRYVAAYVTGVNAALEHLMLPPAEYLLLGAEPLTWSVDDVYALGAVMAYQSGNNFRNELIRLKVINALQDHPDAAALLQPFMEVDPATNPPYVAPPLSGLSDLLDEVTKGVAAETRMLAGPSLGSNGWVVSPRKSQSGHALFAFDSHDGFSMPNLTYEVHLFVGNEQIRGTSVPGLLGVINGFNEFMAWGFTNTGDSQDLFVEEVSSDQLRGQSGWYTPASRAYVIPVAGENPVTVEVRITENGRLISEQPPISLAWSALLAQDASLDALLKLNRATSYEQFVGAMDVFAAPSANVTYADITGRIAFRTLGVLPVRGSGEGLFPLPGSVLNNKWRGIVPVETLPRLVNPPSGFIAAANARVNAGLPLISADNAPGYRMRRIVHTLGASDQLTVESMRKLQTDWYNVQAELLLPELLSGVAQRDVSGNVGEALEILRSWSEQPVNNPDHPAPLIFAAWYRQLAKNLLQGLLEDKITGEVLGSSYVLNSVLDHLILADPSSPWWRGDRVGVMAETLIAAVENLETEYRSKPGAWRWDAAHRVFFRHEMSGAVPGLDLLVDSGPHAWGGGNPTVGRARYNYSRDFTATGGATVRLVVEMSDPPQAYSIMPGGQSGHWLSPHYDDQTTAWLAGELQLLATDPREVNARITRISPSD